MDVPKTVNTDGAPQAIGPYSQAVIIGNLVFASGQIALDPRGDMVAGNIEEQTHQVMQNLSAILRAAGSSLGRAVKATIYLTDLANFSKVNEVYASYLTQPYPARETVAVSELPRGAGLEISMVASLE